MSTPPVAVEVLRGERVESAHRASAAVVRDGRLVLAVGEVERPVYPRSAIKPLQALPLVESGAADAFGLGEAEIALACASHSATPRHLELLAAWLARLRLDERALACGGHPPLDPASAEELIREGRRPTPLFDNCSGKHLGMLTFALHVGAQAAGYHRPEHPVQRAIAAVLAQLAGLPELPAPAVDGCNAPNWPLPLSALAHAAWRFATGAELSPERAAACRRILEACRARPGLIAGPGRPDTRIVASLSDGLVKTGAEGVYLGFFPQAGIGLALKVEDGAGRAAPVALLDLLDHLGLLEASARSRLADLMTVPVTSRTGIEVGVIRPRAGWLAGDAPS